MEEQKIQSQVLSQSLQEQQPSTDTPINTQISKTGQKPFITFMRRYALFLIIAFIWIFTLNKSLWFFSWEKYLQDFYKLGDETFFVKNSKPKNNSEELKKEIFYNTLDTLLEQERKNKDDNSLYKFQFSVWEFSKAFSKISWNYLSNKTFQQDYKEFHNILKKVENFENSKLLKRGWLYEAKKVFFIKNDKFAYAFDYMKRNSEYLIKFYNIQLAEADKYNITKQDLEKVSEQNYIIKITKKSIILYLQNKNTKQTEEMVRYTISTKKTTNKMNTINKWIVEFFQHFTTSFAKKDTLYWLNQRNTYLIHKP